MVDAPVGIFDSGVGGLTVVRAVLDRLPYEPVLYVGDTARNPYGTRRIAQVRAFALEVTDHLVEQGVKALVIACNSASAAVLRDARERYSIPVVEVIHPAVRAAVRATRNGRVGVIGTPATIASGAYDDAFVAAPEVTLLKRACPEFVACVERGHVDDETVLRVAHGYLDELSGAGLDTLILGCTHYPLLSPVISRVMGRGVTLVSSAVETARDLERVLAEHDLLRSPVLGKPDHDFRATGDPEPFLALGQRFLGPEMDTVGAAVLSAQREPVALA